MANFKIKTMTKLLRDSIRRKKMREIKSLAGKIRIDNNWKKLEDEELAE